MNEPVYITRPSLPPLEEVLPYLEEMWASRNLTNCGPFHEQLEVALAEKLGVPYLSLFANGTLALVTALQAKDIHGEVVTTPYSFVATTHALSWNNLSPVFVDVEPDTLNLDPSKIEAAITSKTTAILATHVYGYPCAVEAIQNVADKYGLTVIYDAAHAFGVEDSGGSILRHGDMSVLSFHATKVFNTFEGGAIVSGDLKTKQRIDYLKNFGYADEVTVVKSGINGKMNEFQSALGLVQLKYVDDAIKERAAIDATYRKLLAGTPGIKLHSRPPEIYNHSYFPIFIGADYRCTRDELYQQLRDNNIYARRYFYPLISEFPMYRDRVADPKNQLAAAHKAASEVLCLPIFPGMDTATLEKIVRICTHG